MTTVELLLSGLRLTVNSINRATQVSFADASNCAETLLEFLEQESD
jgi:hypothetical protein